MLKFNLLPLHLRSRFLFAQKVKKAGRYIKIFFGLLGLLSLFLIFILIYLQSQQTLFLGELIQIKRHPHHIAIEKIRKDITQFNNQLKQVFISPPSRQWSLLLIELAEITPPDITLDSLAVQNVNREEKIVIEGLAPRRSDLVQFEKVLREHPSFTNVVSPLSNYQQGENITFQLSFSFKQ